MIVGFRVLAEVRSSGKFAEFTGKVPKTLIYALVPQLLSFKGLRGALSPLSISPLFTIKDDHDLGELASPRVLEEGSSVEPLELNGEYVFHVGGEKSVSSFVASRLKGQREPLAVKIGDSIVTLKIEKVEEVTREVSEKLGELSDKVTVYLKSPTLIYNVFAPGKLVKFSPSAVELFMTPFALSQNYYTITTDLVVLSLPILGRMVETWYSLRTLHPIRVPIKGKIEVCLAGTVTYIIDADEKIMETLRNVLIIAELAGIGRSRLNGFGTVVLSTK